MLIAAHHIKQRKLSIGSANAAATLMKQNNTTPHDDHKTGKKSGLGSKVTSPASPRRLSNKSLATDQNTTVNKHTAATSQAAGKGTKSVKKGSIICLKRRDAAVTEGS